MMFTSESVTEGHPDKICDQISDAIVDHFLAQDPYAMVRAECAMASAIIFIAVRFASEAKVDFSYLARKVITRIGYDQPDFNAKICSILSAPQALSIQKKDRFDEQALSDKDIDKIVVKNQVTVFGFACTQSAVLMPLPIWLAHRLARRLADVRREGILPYLLPDGKVQVGVRYRGGKPTRVHSVTIIASQQTPGEPSGRKLREDLTETVIRPVFEDERVQFDDRTYINVNPEGPYLGGPTHHSGLTGRKNAVDTYGEYSRHSGHALSGKDPLRIDRVGAYASRHAAKNLVAAGLAEACELMLSYTVGLTRPVSLQVQTFGTGKLPDEKLEKLIERHFDFRLAAILKNYGLRRLPAKYTDGFYQKLAVYGHVGRNDIDLPWEQTDRVEALREGG